jgi:hypothetical protein
VGEVATSQRATFVLVVEVQAASSVIAQYRFIEASSI